MGLWPWKSLALFTEHEDGSHMHVALATAATVPSKAFVRVETNEERGQRMA